MTKVSYYTATTLDGFIADEHDSLEWLFKQHGRKQDEPLSYDTFIAGHRRDRDGSHHLRLGGRAPREERRGLDVRHAGVGDDAPPSSSRCRRRHPIRRRRRAHRPRRDGRRPRAGRTCGWWAAATWWAQFADAGLLDEVIVQIAPVTLGAGRPLLPRRLDLRTEQVERNADFVGRRYAVVGPLTV